jgi:hypothetical protein
MARVKTWWKPYLTLLLEGILLSFELWRFWRILGFDTFSSFFLFLFFFRTRTQASFASTYQEINNKDYWSNLLNDNDKV